MYSPLARRIAEDLLEIGAVTFAVDRPFVWASGLRSPIYCDNRLTISYPHVRRRIRDGFLTEIRSAGFQTEVIIGTATAGIPHAAWLAEALDLPMAYVRSKPKEYGRRSQIEGCVAQGARAIIIEDLISTGGSSKAVVETVRSAGILVDAVAAIFSYELPESRIAFEEAGIPLVTLTSFDVLLEVALERNILEGAAAASIDEWKKDPRAWSESRSGRG
ncbi:MAG: orotate phosphoribosyltransferase [Rhodothermales bacterium]